MRNITRNITGRDNITGNEKITDIIKQVKTTGQEQQIQAKT